MYCFNAVKKAGCSHQKEVVGYNRKSTSMECFKWVKTILGNVKNAIPGRITPSISRNMAIVIWVSTSIASTGASTLQKCFHVYV
jgi:hypothetical protein